MATETEKAEALHDWVLVPREPTYNMKLTADMVGDYPWDGNKTVRIWQAMLAASPTPPEPDGWLPIATAKIDGEPIDLWLRDVDSDEPGWLFPYCTLLSGVPHPFLHAEPDGSVTEYHPDQNGQYVSHWRRISIPEFKDTV